MGKHSVSIGDGAFTSLADYCTKNKIKYQPFVEEAILKMVNDKQSNSYVEIQLENINFEKIKQIRLIVKEMVKFINFFDTYAETNEEDMLKAIGNNKKRIDLIKRVFSSGKEEANDRVAPMLENVLNLLDELKNSPDVIKKKHRSKEEWEALKDAIKEVKAKRVK